MLRTTIAPPMWQLENLPTVASPERSGAPLCFFDVGLSAAPLCQIDFQANYLLPGTKVLAEPTIVLAAVPTYTGSSVTLSVDLAQVDAIVCGQTTFTLAQDPANPKPNEFTYQPSSLVLYPSRPIEGLPIQILGGAETTPTDIVDASILQVFYGLPIVAQVQWSLSAENHPSGSINLRVIGDDNESLVGQRFRKGSEITFANIGFSVLTYTKKLLNTDSDPGRMWEVSISLGGKWEARKYNRPAFLIPRDPNQLVSVPSQDPDCALGGSGGGSVGVIKPAQRSLSEIAKQVDVPFVGFASIGAQTQQQVDANRRPTISIQRSGGITTFVSIAELPLKAWSIPIPADTSLESTTTWQEIADNLKRQNGCHIDYSNPNGIYARDIYGGQKWAYSVPAIQIAYKGDCTNVDDNLGYAVEYPATKLSGLFSQPLSPASEQDQNKAKWKRRDVVYKTFRSGDLDPDIPPDTFPLIRNMSMTFDTSGPTKEEIIVTTYDGVEMFKKRTVWGAVYNSDQVTEDLQEGEIVAGLRKHGPVIATSSQFWQIVQQEITVTEYDPDTRYITGTTTTGFRKGRFQQETDALEVLDYVGSTDPEDIYRLSLYRFQNFPVYAIERKQLEQFTSYYSDTRKEPIPTDYEKKCNPNGSSSIKAVRNPNWVEPMFEIAHLSYSNSFAHTRNPDTDPDDPLPDYTQGEERQTYKTIEILPSINTVFGDTDGRRVLSYDAFIDRQYENSTQGAQFGEFTSRRTFSTSDGRPSAAQRLPDLFEKEEPEQKGGDPNIFTFTSKQNFEYILTTPGYAATDASTNSVSFQYAQHLSEAIAGAESDLKFRDIQESIEYSATIPTNFQIRPLDYISLNDGVNVHKCRVTSINNTILIQGDVDDYPLVVAPQNTEIVAGIDRDIPVTLSQKNLLTPQPITQPRENRSHSIGLSLGDVVPKNLQGRGNY